VLDEPQDDVANEPVHGPFAEAQNNLGAMYGNGQGVTQDYV